MKYDLTRLRSRREYRTDRGMRWLAVCLIVVGGLAIVFDGGLQAILYATHLSHASVQPYVGIVLFFEAGFILFGILFFRQAGPGTISAEVSDDGVIFQYSGGRSRQLNWSDPRFVLRIDRDDRRARYDAGEPRIVAIGHSPVKTFLTREVFDEIVRQASAHGLRIASEPRVYGDIRFTISPTTAAR
jgi:hypothetical protein